MVRLFKGFLFLLEASMNLTNGSAVAATLAIVFIFIQIQIREATGGEIPPIEFKVVSSASEESDHFGASFAISGRTLVVGAPQDGENGMYAGTAYIFSESGAVWLPVQRITPSDATRVQYFGSSIAIDGDIMAIGAPNDGPISTGAVYIFERDGLSWKEKEKLIAEYL
jgi:hypothetical protein